MLMYTLIYTPQNVIHRDVLTSEIHYEALCTLCMVAVHQNQSMPLNENLNNIYFVVISHNMYTRHIEYNSVASYTIVHNTYSSVDVLNLFKDGPKVPYPGTDMGIIREDNDSAY